MSKKVRWRPLCQAPRDGTLVMLLAYDYSGIIIARWVWVEDKAGDSAWWDQEDEVEGDDYIFAAWSHLPPNTPGFMSNEDRIKVARRLWPEVAGKRDEK